MTADLEGMAVVFLASEEGPVMAAENLGNRCSVQRETERREGEELNESFLGRLTHRRMD